MADLSAEPSMEEILSSIKRIIAEEGDQPVRRGRPARPPAAAPLAGSDEEVLELSEALPVPQLEQADPRPIPDQRPALENRAMPEPRRAPEPAPAEQPRAEPIVSSQAAAASRGALESLSRLVVKPEPGADGTLEGLVREMLRPMLREWLDANLPAMVEAMVEREIKRISNVAS